MRGMRGQNSVNSLPSLLQMTGNRMARHVVGEKEGIGSVQRRGRNVNKFRREIVGQGRCKEKEKLPLNGEKVPGAPFPAISQSFHSPTRSGLRLLLGGRLPLALIMLCFTRGYCTAQVGVCRSFWVLHSNQTRPKSIKRGRWQLAYFISSMMGLQLPHSIAAPAPRYPAVGAKSDFAPVQKVAGEVVDTSGVASIH